MRDQNEIRRKNLSKLAISISIIWRPSGLNFRHCRFILSPLNLWSGDPDHEHEHEWVDTEMCSVIELQTFASLFEMMMKNGHTCSWFTFLANDG